MNNILNTLSRSIIFTILALQLPQTVIHAQQPDSLQPLNIEFLTDQLENIAQTTDFNLDYSDLIDDYLYYAIHPININGSDIILLRNIYLINDIQLNNLRLYINQFGQLYSIYELASISGFDEETISKLQPFIVIGAITEVKKYTPKQIFNYARHELLLRGDQILEKRKAFSLPPDSAIHHPGSVYLGNPQHYYLRYSFNYRNKIRIGITMDKDAGEVMFKGQLSDSIKNLINNKLGNGYDFISAFAYAEDIGIVKKVVVGDYHLEFGQGLTLWSGLAFGKSPEGVQMKKFGRGIRPNTSANENRFFRGAAATLGWKRISFTPFYSSNNVDGNIVPLVYNEQDGVSSIIETGMHRTITELLDKNTINISAFGGHVAYQHMIFAAGVTAYRTLLNKPLVISDELYKQFNFQGTEITNYGVDMALNLKNINFFSEFSGSSNGGIAGIVGINAFLDERFFLTMVYHNYGKEYQNLYSNPFAESSAIANEAGIYFGFKALVNKYLSISGYVDHYNFPWLKYRVSTPSTGRDYLAQINFNASSDIIAYLRYRFKNKQENFNEDYNYMPLIGDIKRHELRFLVSYNVWDNIIFKNRIDVVIYDNNFTNTEHGYLIYQDVLYRPDRFPLEATFRYSLFSTDSYNSRIYTYENDVLYAFSIPSYFNNGQRWYLMLKWKIIPQISIWLRYARTTYFNQNTVGSGNDLIDGNTKSEVKVEVRIRL
ncbi:MAG: hypothetical protein H8E34_03070 [Bacteroidetes bacterium]|nr:hypothetical protein [Bacteroidota bacterium]MBL6942916.1 hypothetical protein [Bacteroidales bacterium]